ncbi:MAG TPA: hypothetical protein GXX41_12985 [Thermoanaerobacterium sp.]|nr:hypothetical protein [Thermoanaerobacterium sp.]
MYIRIAKKNPVEDYSVPGWAPNSVIIENTNAFGTQDAEAIIEELEEKGLVVEFTKEELQQAIENDTVDELPQIHAGAVCCYKVNNLEEWLEKHYDDLERMGYFTNGVLAEDMRIWEVFGKEKDVDDIEGVYIVVEDAKDITNEIKNERGK